MSKTHSSIHAFVMAHDASLSQEPTFIGPYTVVRRTLHDPYLLRDHTGAIYPRHVPVDQRKVVFSNDKYTHLTSMSDEGEVDDVYEVDYIMDHKESEDAFEYLVKWKGYDKSEATWSHRRTSTTLNLLSVTSSSSR